MTADVAPGSHALGASHFNMSSIAERMPLDNMNTTSALPSSNSLLGFSRLDRAQSNTDSKDVAPAILIRKLPRAINLDMLKGMLLFAKDLSDVTLVDTEFPDDQSYSAAVAYFKSTSGAHEAKKELENKPLSGDAKLIVEVYSSGNVPFTSKKSAMDASSARKTSSSSSLATFNNGLGQSRYNGAFTGLTRLSPPLEGYSNRHESRPMQAIFSPTSPLGNNAISSKSMINDDDTDDTGRLVDDPVAFAKNGESEAVARREYASHMLPNRFGGLSLNTAGSPINGGPSAMASPPLSGFISPRSNGHSHTPASAMSPNGLTPMTSNGSHPHFGLNSPYGRFQYPPANPADQNPPCNTLYVGNLPMDTSEDELKTLFSKSRGYKRLCFRTKQNGPMCFVEFEDVTFATKALNELYGHPLHNSVKGGIRLSFSKNPLGVRNGQNANTAMSGNTMGMNGMLGMMSGPMSPGGYAMPSMSGGMTNGTGAPPGFTSNSGPPPGLSAPPGFAMSSNDYMGGPYNPGSRGPLYQSVANTDYGHGHGYGNFMSR